MTARQLRDAGFIAEADLLDAARRRRDLFSPDGGLAVARVCASLVGASRPTEASRDRALALGVFGSRRFNELARAVGVQTW